MSKFAKAIGECAVCGEWTEALRPCCNNGVYYHGAVMYPEDFAELENTELYLFGKVEPLTERKLKADD